MPSPIRRKEPPKTMYISPREPAQHSRTTFPLLGARVPAPRILTFLRLGQPGWRLVNDRCPSRGAPASLDEWKLSPRLLRRAAWSAVQTFGITAEMRDIALGRAGLRPAASEPF